MMTTGIHDPRHPPEPSDRVPTEVISRATAAFERPGGHHELAALVYDSLAEGATSSEHFWLVFQNRGAQLQVSVRPNDPGWDLRGRIDPPDASRVELEVDGPELAVVEIPTGGEFTFRAVPPGVIRVRLMGPGDAALLETDWFLMGARAEK